MTKKTTIIGSDTWEWEETPETIEALKRLHATVQLHNDMRKENERTKLATPLKEGPKKKVEAPSTTGEA